MMRQKVAEKYENCFEKETFSWNYRIMESRSKEMVNPQLVRMSQETGIELVATNDVHYTYAEDAEAHDILLCIQTGKKLSDENRMRYEGGQYYVKSEEEMRKLFPLQVRQSTTHKRSQTAVMWRLSSV